MGEVPGTTIRKQTKPRLQQLKQVNKLFSLNSEPLKIGNG
jgi:hypothetical protein